MMSSSDTYSIRMGLPWVTRTKRFHAQVGHEDWLQLYAWAQQQERVFIDSILNLTYISNGEGLDWVKYRKLREGKHLRTDSMVTRSGAS